MGALVKPYPLPFLAVNAEGWCNLFGSEKICIAATAASIATYANAISTQIYCLMYRIIVLLPNKRIYHTFNSIPTKIFMQIFVFLIIGPIAFGFYDTCIFKEELPMHPTTEDHWMIIKEYVDSAETALMFDLEHVNTIGFLFLSGGLLAFSEILSFSMVSGILLYLRTRAHLFSKATYKLHMQYTILLGIQLFTPLILLIGPVGIYIHFLFKKAVLHDQYIAAGFLVFTTYGFVNGLFTLILIAPYRRRARQQLIDPILKLFCPRSRLFAATDTNQRTSIQVETTKSINPPPVPRI